MEHGFVERAQRVQLVAGGEADTGNPSDDVAQELTAVVAVGTGERALITKQDRAADAWFLIVDKREQFVASDAVGFGGSIAPAIG